MSACKCIYLFPFNRVMGSGIKCRLKKLGLKMFSENNVFWSASFILMPFIDID